MLLDEDEASRFVEATRRIVLGDAETQCSVSLGDAGLDEVDEKSSSDPLVPTGGDDCNGQFGHVLSDEAIAMRRLGIRAIPSRTHRSVLFGNESVVALSRPSREVQRVPRIGHHLRSGRCRLVRTPDSGLTKHRGEKGEVLRCRRSTPKLVHAGQSSRSAERVSGKRGMTQLENAWMPRRSEPPLVVAVTAVGLHATEDRTAFVVLCRRLLTLALGGLPHPPGVPAHGLQDIGVTQGRVRPHPIQAAVPVRQISMRAGQMRVDAVEMGYQPRSRRMHARLLRLAALGNGRDLGRALIFELANLRPCGLHQRDRTGPAAALRLPRSGNAVGRSRVVRRSGSRDGPLR